MKDKETDGGQEEKLLACCKKKKKSLTRKNVFDSMHIVKTHIYLQVTVCLSEITH